MFWSFYRLAKTRAKTRVMKVLNVVVLSAPDTCGDFSYGQTIIGIVLSMGFLLDGVSFHCAHTWSKSGISICCTHLVTSKKPNPIFFVYLTYFTYYVLNMF